MNSVHKPKDRYKEKECPVCHKKHKKRGIFCGISCANRQRPMSDNIRENMRKVGAEYKQTPEGIANSLMVQNPVKAEDFQIDIPNISDYDLPPGYDAAEDW